jgi:hypothetical protein
MNGCSTEDRALAWRGVTHGLPYILQDRRPGGFLGRSVPHRFPELNSPQRVVDWSESPTRAISLGAVLTRLVT